MSELENFRVVKLGGSLLGGAGVGARVMQWLQLQPQVPTAWVVGGGKLVDVVRAWQTTHNDSANVSDVDVHWMSVDLMSTTAKMFAGLMGAWPIESSLESLQQQLRGGTQHVIFDCRAWLGTVENLPCSWSVTSDSIAGRLAIELSCQELVLLKSCAAVGKTVRENVAQGVIDEHFEKLELTCQVTIVNLNTAVSNR